MNLSEYYWDDKLFLEVENGKLINIVFSSTQCQSRHWEADHKSKCKQLRSSNKVDSFPSGGDGYQRRKSSISLVPARGSCKVLQEPKKVKDHFLAFFSNMFSLHKLIYLSMLPSIMQILFPYDEFVKLFNWDKPGFPPCGLLNCRNRYDIQMY